MKYTNIQFTVKSAKQAKELANYCAMFYTTAKITSMSHIGGVYQDGHAVVRCSYENDHHGRLAWEKLVTTLIRHGYSDCIN